MKILFNGSMYGAKPTGVGIFVREIFNKLIEQNLITKESAIYTYSKAYAEKQAQVKIIKLPVILEAVFKRSLAFHRIVWNYFFLPALAKKYDLVYSFSSHGSPFIKNQIITIHDLICLAFPSHHKMQYYYFKYLLPSIIKSSVKIVAVSEYTKKEVADYYHINPEKIKVINGAADHLQKAASFDVSNKEKKIVEWLAKKRFFLSVGASNKHKNLERLIAAMKMLEDDTILIIIGSGSNNYRKILKAKYSDAKVCFLDYVSSALLGYLYENCIANVYVSLYEGMGFPPYEAAIYNTVSIVSNVTAIPEIYGDSVFYVNPENTEEIHKALELFSNNSINKELYISKFPALLNKYKWKHTAVKIASVINSELRDNSNVKLMNKDKQAI